jgi:hypothetical protein
LQSSIAENEPIIFYYTNWADWSEYWRDHITALDLYRPKHPNTQSTLPLLTDKANREIVKQGSENFTKLRQHVSKECRKLITFRDVWVALRAGCDRGTAFHNDK